MKQYRSNSEDSTALYDENIQSPFFEDSRQNIWFTTYQAIHSYDRKHDNFKHYFLRDKSGVAIKEDYKAFAFERDSFLWLVCGRKLFRFNIFQPNAITEIDSISALNCIAEKDALGHIQYIYSVSPSSFQNEYLVVANSEVVGRKKWFQGISPIPKSVNSVMTENDTLTWLGTSNGLLAWNRQTESFRLVKSLPNKSCSFIANGEKALIVLMPEVGLIQFNREDESSALFILKSSAEKAVSPKTFDNLHLDRQGNLWISFESNGLAFANLRKTKFNAMPKQPNSNKNAIWNYLALLEDREGNIWHGTNTDGLFVLNHEGKLKSHFMPDPLKSNSLPFESVPCLHQDRNGHIWVGTAVGFSQFSPPNSFIPVYTEKEENKSFFIDIHQLRNGEIITTTFSNGVFMIKRIKGKAVLVNILKSNKGFTTIYQDSSDRIYICKNETEIGVYKLINEKLDSIETLPIRGGVCGYFENVNNNTLYIATLNGLAKVDLNDLKKKPIILTEKNGLPDKYITAMLADRNQNLWLSTAKGLAYFNMDSVYFRTFSLADGMQSTEFYLSAALKRHNGELWFGGSNGITIVNPNNITYLANKPIVKITDIKINDLGRPGLADDRTGATNISQIRHLDLDYSDNTLSFEFVAIEYSDPANNRLRYMLKGADDHWVDLKKGELGFARYPKLKNNTYTLVIQGANSDGVWGEPIEALQITINPHWTNTAWFKISLAAIIALISWLIIRYRIAQIREKADLNTRVAENKMAALRSQMNPHFVFNSLQTVNGFIAKQDLRGAMEYINQFARLMRVILENSREGQISLEREIELLELYMKIESRRFGTPFTYAINVGDNIDTYSMEIPSMLLQPFVENAIKHGLFHKKDGGHINIAFIQENKSLKCVVEDNGVGRAKTAELNTQQGRGHKSRGLQIVNERLAIIRAANPGNYDVKISDLFDRQQNPSGTRVEITLPLS